MEENLEFRLEATYELSGLEIEVYSLRKQKTSFWKKLSEAYFKPKPIETWKNGKIYEILGVKHVEKLVMGTIGKLFRKMGMDKFPNNYFVGKRLKIESVKEFEKGTRLNELIHAPQILWNSYGLVHDLSNGNYVGAVFWIGLLVLNSSLTILQRYNRVRAYNIIEKLEERELKRKYSYYR